MKPLLVLVASAGALTLLAACGGSETSTQDPSPAASVAATTEEPTTEPSTKAPALPAGAYVDYADYQADQQAYAAGDVVLFFNATWCPTCQEATKNLEAADFPEGLTVVSVDYDSNLDLRKKYGVTTQHTFVAIKPNGDQIKKWSGSMTADAIQAKV